jgi:RimJ/RimL family protein N-acetyltransferase
VEPIELSARFFTLRAPEPADAAWVYDACQDPLIARWTRAPSPYRASDAVAFVQGAVGGWGNGEDLRFVIEVTDTGELLGACGLTVRSGDAGLSQDAEIGFWLSADGRGRGAATAAVGALVKWAPSIGIGRVWAVVKHGNVASETVLERCGFVLVDTSATCDAPDGSAAANRWERSVASQMVPIGN